MKNILTTVYFLSLLSCATFKPIKNGTNDQSAPSGTLETSVFAVSGIGDGGEYASALLAVVKRQLNEVGDRGTLLMLGNFGPKSGFPDSSHLQNQRKHDVILSSTIDLVSGHTGNSYMIMGQ